MRMIAEVQQPVDQPIEIVIPEWLENSGFVTMGIALLALANKYVLKPKLSKLSRSLTTSLREDQVIQGQLNQLLGVSGAQRALLLQPHNGEYYTNGGEVFKLSATHEALDLGYTSVQHKLQNVPIGLVRDLLNAKETVFCSKTCVSDLSGFIKDMLLAINGTGFVWLPITHEEHLVGVVILLYSGAVYEQSLYVKVQDRIEEIASAISAMLLDKTKPNFWQKAIGLLT